VRHVLKQYCGFYSQEVSQSGKTRYIYHLWLRKEAEPLMTDIRGDLAIRIQRMTKMQISFASGPLPYALDTNQPRFYQKPSQHYDSVVAMVEEDFPSLAPFIIRKRASKGIRYEETTGPGLPLHAVDYMKLIISRKQFKFQQWANWYQKGGRPK
jgi:hypothetical protein